ncbi:gamma-glutamyltransferase [Leptolyngbya iicbica]|uniref:Glutathione hydrolase proenzyme n=2 Tax=Cyanophyceae TaxID=3028117 RepID=A0A4Q7EB73_9CYAN|nr:gamma-glutamyltransferase [Leptolyngbya sp. LK]RZM79888.1 gamma-glutamyltransferase [Leptolyngbya sp. LK]
MAHRGGTGKGVVAAGHALTAAAGAEILRQGGNAFDAAIAAVMTAWVTESVLTSAGGGGFLLAHTHNGRNCLFDFFSQTPRSNRLSRSPDFYPIYANFGDTVQEFHIGLGSIAVPGAAVGLLHVHERLGKLPLAAIAEPAIHHAQQGVTVNPFLAYVYELLDPILTATDAAKAMYTQQGKLLRAGDTLAMPDFAKTLKLMVEHGAAIFCEGAIAQQIDRDCRAAGGYLTLADLQAYRVIERQPLSLSYRDTTFLTNPPPSSGGTLIAFALKLLETLDWRQLPHGSDRHLACLSQVMALTNTARRDGFDHCLYDPDVATAFLQQSHLQPYQATLADRVNRLGSTTHVSVIDSEGNAASVTTSNGEGSSYVVPQTGMMLNNMLGEEDLHPQGFHQWAQNQRISSMMAPTMILQEGQPELVLGSGGSNRIRTAILQVIANVVDFGMPLEAAIAAPRIHWERGTLHLEPAAHLPLEALNDLPDTDTVIPWQQQNMYFGGVHAVGVDAQGNLHGAGDARRGGAVAFA